MEKRQTISQYRERLDKTLASSDLKNRQMLKALVKKQLIRSSQDEVGGFSDNLVEKRTAEVSNFLDMLRSASICDTEASKTSEASYGEWKLKQDTEEFRVMYREGPEGTPFHSLLVEGYVDGSLDVCLCVSWESVLYRKWWPQYNFPAFKIMSCKCLQKVRIGEQISLVRVKVTWPLSTREALIHYFLFEYFQDDLVVVLVNTISDLGSIDKSTHGFTKDGIPEAKDVVRIGLVGGFAIQKVTQKRSYFRTIANLDMKLDFVPPSLINFISRQLVGNGFKLYQKIVASVSNSDEDYDKALKDPLYCRIREALYSTTKSNEVLKNDAYMHPNHDSIDCIKDGLDDTDEETGMNDNENVSLPGKNDNENVSLPGKNDNENVSLPYKPQTTDIKVTNEIEEEEIEECSPMSEEEDGVDPHTSLTVEIPLKHYVNGKTDVVISPRVQQALETLEKAIYVVREYANRSSSGPMNQEFTKVVKETAIRDSSSLEEKVHPNVEVSAIQVSEKGATEKAVLQEPKNSTGVQNISRPARSNSYTRELNHNRIAPESLEPYLHSPNGENQVTLKSSQNGTSDIPILVQTVLGDKKTSAEANGIHENTPNAKQKLTRPKRHRFCCLTSFAM